MLYKTTTKAKRIKSNNLIFMEYSIAKQTQMNTSIKINVKVI